MVTLGQRIEVIASTHENIPAMAHRSARLSEASKAEIQKIISDIKELLGRIDREIPLLQLAITASGESLSSSLPPGISPSRLLQASTLLTVSDTQFSQIPEHSVQVGPVFCLSLYMLFLGHTSAASQAANDPSSANHEARVDSDSDKEKRPYGLREGDRKPIWQEVVHKARVQLWRTPRKSLDEGEYRYHLEIVEDQDDGRVHEAGNLHDPLGNTLEERIPIHQISKIFYTDSGRLLNIGSEDQDSKNPVLLIKRDVNALPPTTEVQRMPEYCPDSQYTDAVENVDIVQAQIDQQLHEESFIKPTSPTKELPDNSGNKGFPKHVDPEWIAMEMFEEDVDIEGSSIGDGGPGPELPSNSFIGGQSPAAAGRSRESLDAKIEAQIKNLRLRSRPEEETSYLNSEETLHQSLSETSTKKTVSRSPFRAITTSLSLIEMLIRLVSLQEFQQASHLSIPDHILTFFLEETSTTGLVGEARWRARKEAKRRVGFDPYSDGPKE